MNTFRISIILLFFTAIPELYGQKISKIDYDQIKLAISDSESRTYYPKLLKRFKDFDPTLNEYEFTLLYYGYTFDTAYSPYGEGNSESEFFRLFRDKKFEDAISPGKLAFESNPIKPKLLLRLLICFDKLGDKESAKKYAYLYFGLLDAIYRSGDGKSTKTAYVVIQVDDEYEVLADKGLIRTQQALLVGDFDKLTIDIKSQKKIKGQKKIKEIYFSISKMTEYLHNQFRKEEKK